MDVGVRLATPDRLPCLLWRTPPGVRMDIVDRLATPDRLPCLLWRTPPGVRMDVGVR